MDKVKQIIISLLVVFISLLIIDEGKIVYLIGDNIQICLNHDQNKELEILQQHNDEKWMNLNSFELSYSSVKLLLFPCYPDRGTEDYAELVWQPPEFA